MAEELEETKVLWLLTYCDGFSNAWSVFYAPSQAEAECLAKEWIGQLTYHVTDIKLTTYPRSSRLQC
jgi:hypothetical protein